MKTSVLARLPFLQDAPPSTIAAVKRVLLRESVTAGTVLFHIGDDGDACYLVESGTLSVTAGVDGEVLATVGPGSFVGELALLLSEPRSATVTALTDTELFVLMRNDLSALIADHPSISVAMTRELGRRIVQVNQRFTGGLQARRTIVWPASKIAPIAEGIVRYGRRVGAAAIAGGALGSLPDGVERVKSPRYGADDNRVDAVLLGVGDTAQSRTAAVVGGAEHVLAFGDAPAWLRAAAPPDRYVRLSDDAPGLRRAVRWATGRAVGIAMSSGGSKAIAHLGVWRVLDEAGVEFDAVAGASGGSLGAVGIAFGQGEPYAQRVISDVAQQTRLRRLDFRIPPRSGLSRGRRLRDAFAKWDIPADLADAEVPVWIVAADMATGGTVVMRSGPVADILRASLSVPGLFEPWRLDGKVLLDGAVANPLPTDLLREAGVGVVLASNVAGQSSEVDVSSRLPGLGQVVGRVLNTMERERIRSLLPLADVVIRPKVSAASTFDFANVGPMIDAGMEAARERLPDILTLLSAASGRAPRRQ